jgi:hypothetical protein
MADTLVERVTGQTAAADVNAELQILIPIDALLDAGDKTAAQLPGYGPLPADIARDILATSKGPKWWRPALRRTGGWADRWRPVPATLRRFHEKVDHGAEPGVSRPVL